MKYFLFLLVLLGLFIFLPQTASAQTCSQSTFSWTYWTCPNTPEGPKCVGEPRTSTTNCSYNGFECSGQEWVTTNCVETASGCNVSSGFIQYICGLGGTSPPPPLPTAPPGPTATPIPGWGGCGSCGNCDNNPPGSGSHPSGECVRDPYGSCVWDIGCRYVPPPAEPSCDINLTGPATVPFGGQGSQWVSFNSVVGTVNRVLFDVNPVLGEPGGYGYVSPLQDTVAAYSTTFFSDRSGYGPTRVRARVFMNGESTPRCVDRHVFTVEQPPPSCTIRVVGPSSIPFGGSAGYTVVVDEQNFGLIQRVDWNISQGALLGTISPTTDNTTPFSTVFTHNRSDVGTIRVRARAYMDSSATPTCSVASNLTTIEDAPGWFQAMGSYAIAETANIRNLIPNNTLRLIEPVTGVLDSASAIFGGTLNLGQGTVSDTNRNVNTVTSANNLSYDVLHGLIPAGISPRNLGSSVTGSYLNTVSGTSYEGYQYYRRVGDLIITGPLAMSTNSRKIIIYVNGNLTLNGNVTYAGSSRSTQFIMFIVSGNININSAVTELHGIYYADGTISTGAGDQQLHTYGSIVSDLISFDRDLGSSNAEDPAEQLEYDPNIYFNYPRALVLPKVVWQEVAPGN